MRITRLSSIALTVGFAALLTSSAQAQCPGTDDAFEDNDDCTTPWALGAGTYPGLYCEVEASDPDYFQVTVQNGEVISAQALFAHANGDIDMRLYDLGCVNQLDSSGSVTDNEDVTWTNTTGAAADVVVLVYVYSNSTLQCNNYDLVIDLFPDPCIGADDGLEENDDCGTAGAGPIGTVPSLFVSKTDPDYYAYTMLDGDTLNVDALFLHANGDIDIRLYDSTCSSTLASSGSTTDNESLSYTNTSGGAMDVVLYVLVWSGSSSDCNTYDLVTDLGGGGGCTITKYCNPGSGSSNNVANLDISGCDLTSSAVLALSNGPAGQFAYALIGDGSSIISDPPGALGDLCITGGGCLGRYSKDIGSIDGSGAYSVDISNSSTGGPNYGIPTCGGNIASGQTWQFQVWHRNPMGAPAGFSEAISVTFQ